MFKVLRFLRLLKKQTTDKAQNKESSNIRPLPKTFREDNAPSILFNKMPIRCNLVYLTKYKEKIMTNY
jgi:hypothetical protein